MELIRTFEITSDEFYDYLEEQLVSEIQKATHKKLSKNIIRSGYKFENKDAKSKITINQYERGKIYQSTVRSATSYVRITYQTQEKEEGLEIRFEQFVSGYDDQLDKKNIFSKTIHNIVSFGRMSNALYDMRTDIINKRNGVEKQKEFQRPDSFKKVREKLQEKYEEQDR